MNWTKPYCGVEHLEGIPSQFQITLERGNTATIVYEILFAGLKILREYIGPYENAKRQGEEWGLALIDEWKKE